MAKKIYLNVLKRVGNIKGDDTDSTDDTRRYQVGLQTTEDDLQTTEDDLDMLKMAKICCFHQINKDSLNPFECSEMMGTIKGR